MFMNYIKLQTDILKAVDARENKHKPFEWHYGLKDETLYITDGYGLWIIPKPFNYLNIETVFHNEMPKELHKLVDESDLVDVVMTNRKVALPNATKKNQLAVVLQMNNAESDELWVDEAMLKYFDLADCTFKAKNPKSLIYVYGWGNLIGAVLPVRH